MRTYYIYILTNRSGTLYVGMTNNLKKRLWQHKHKVVRGFTSRYNLDLLVYYETCDDARTAVNRERQIKSWRREKKMELINSINPQFRDLGEDLV